MKVAIVEDEVLHRELLAAYVQGWNREKKLPLQLRYYENAEQFLFSWEDENFDVLFLDIQMSGMNGMDLAKKIRQKDKTIFIVFTTGIADYIEEGYEVEALHYLIKPIKETKVHACLDKAIQKRKKKQILLIHREEEVQKIPLEEINYVEARGHGTVIGLSYQPPAEAKESISELESILGQAFIKCHRSYLCRIDAVHRIDKNNVFFDDGSCVPISRRMYSVVNQAFIQHFRKI